MKIQKWLNKNCPSLEGKTIVITGTTSGIGLETFKHLVALGANIVVGVRNIKKAEEHIKSLNNLAETQKVSVFQLDLEDISSIKTFASNIKTICPNGIYALINNAGAYPNKSEILKYGYEKHFFVNFVAPLFLSNLLLPLLEKTKDSKLIFVSSISQYFVNINLNNIDFKNQKSKFKIYANSKRWLTLVALKLKQDLESKNSNVSINIIHPGITASSLFAPKDSNAKNARFKFLDAGERLLFPKTKKACLSEIYALYHTKSGNNWIGPSTFKVYGFPKFDKLKINNKIQKQQITCSKIADKILKYLDKM